MTDRAQIVSSRTLGPYVERLSIRNYRGLTSVDVEFEPTLTVLAGRNNSGKSRIITALQLALGGRPADVDDFTVGSTSEPEIDVIIAPPPPGEATSAEEFDELLTPLFEGQIQVLIESPLRERIAWRTSVSRSAEGAGARSETRFLTFDARTQSWELPVASTEVRVRQRRAFAVDLINTGRDLRDELARQGSSIRRVLADLEVSPEKREPLESDLEDLSRRILAESDTLSSVAVELSRLHNLVGSIGSPALNALPGSLEELGRLISIDLDTGNGALPIRFHGAGSRSLSSLQVQGVLYDRRLGKDGSAVPPTPVTLVEEPEAHLHPQAAMELPELLNYLRGQKVVSTHSAHLVTSIEPSSIRLIQTRREGVRVVDLGPASSDALATHRTFRPALHTEAMEKIRRLVERPFGELLFASCVLLGDGATERAFLPVVLRYALASKSHGVAVIDPGSLSNELASAVVRFATLTEMPCFIFADSDNAGVEATRTLVELAGDASPTIIWINGKDAVGSPIPGAIEAMLLSFDEPLCRAACLAVRPDLTGTTKTMLKKLKGSSGAHLGRALIERYPDVGDWPLPLKLLIEEMAKVL